MLIAIPVGIASAVVLAILWLYLTPLDDLSFQPSPIEFLFTLAGIIVVHELLHAVATPGAGLSDKTIVGFYPSRLSFYAAYTGEITRNRYVAVFLVPLFVISILPLLFALIGRFSWVEMAGISILNALLSCGDLVGVTLIFFQIPRDGIVKNRGWRSYWRPPAIDAEQGAPGHPAARP